MILISLNCTVVHDYFSLTNVILLPPALCWVGLPLQLLSFLSVCRSRCPSALPLSERATVVLVGMPGWTASRIRSCTLYMPLEPKGLMLFVSSWLVPCIGSLLNCCALEKCWVQDFVRLNCMGDLVYIEKDCCLLNSLQHVILYKCLLLQKQSGFLVGYLKYCSLTTTLRSCL